tara:strand:+ start:4314 stop:4787 length:474 start_codon:yes stop_codon:yes gene_type:complete
MAYQKLQGKRAINVYPTDNVIIPAPGDEAVSGNTDANTANKLVDSTALFQTKSIIPGATVYNTDTGAAATVTGVDSPTTLSLSADIFTAQPEAYVVYNTNNSEGPVLFVGTGGTLTIKTVGGDVVQLTNVANGSFIPIMVQCVQNSGTTSSGIIALW